MPLPQLLKPSRSGIQPTPQPPSAGEQQEEKKTKHILLFIGASLKQTLLSPERR